VLVPCFSVAALVRTEPGLRDHPVGVVRGVAPTRVIVEASPQAKVAGVVPGMPEGQAKARCHDLIIRAVSEERDRLAHTALLAIVLGTSPRVEDGGRGVVYVDLGGLGGLFGDEAAIGQRLWRHARGIGLPACIGIAGSRASAQAAARLGRPVTRLAPGGEAHALAEAPLEFLDLGPELQARLGRWGIRTLGDLAKLPRVGLGERLGEPGLRAQDLARGVDRRPFRLYTPPPLYREAHELDWEIASFEHLAPIARSLLDRLVSRLHLSHLAADRLTVRFGLANGGRDERTIAFAHPLDEAPTMLTLLRLDLEARPVSTAIIHLAVSAHPVRVRAEQGGLDRPPSPGARDLAAVLARLTDLVGPLNVGCPAVVDSHRSGMFHVLPFDSPADESASHRRIARGTALRIRDRDPVPSIASVAPGARPREAGDHGLLAMRRLRPWVAAEVEMYAGRPISMVARSIAGHVVACAGPWRTSGEWWRASGDTGDSEELSDGGGWAHDEWDIALSDGTLCRLVWDHRRRAWFLAGIYD
jgi:protein ImuB